MGWDGKLLESRGVMDTTKQRRSDPIWDSLALLPQISIHSSSGNLECSKSETSLLLSSTTQTNGRGSVTRLDH